MLQNGTGVKLSQKQLMALPQLVSAPSVTQAAVVVGVSRTTVYRWLNDPAFKYELDRYRQEAAEEAQLTLKGMLAQAVNTVSSLLRSDDPRVRLGAARLALTFGFRVLEDDDIKRRLELLENSIDLWKERHSRAF